MLTDADLLKIGKLMDAKLRPIKKDVRSLISYHDEYYVRLRKRVEKIEDHLRI